MVIRPEEPRDRRAIHVLDGGVSVFVIWGLVLTGIAAVVSGTLSVRRMAPTWLLQAGLLAAFASAYHYSTIERLWPTAARTR